MKKALTAALAAAILISFIYFVGSGFNVRDDVYLTDFVVGPYKDEMTIVVGVASSIGYTRAVKNVSDDPQTIELQFYSAFGGINGSIGEKHRFVIELPAECKEIYFSRFGSSVLTLYKDDTTGEWRKTG